MNDYSILDEASHVACGRDEMWEVYREHRSIEARIALSNGGTLVIPAHIWNERVAQRTDYPAPMSLIEIARLRAQSRRHWWSRLPQLNIRWPW